MSKIAQDGDVNKEDGELVFNPYNERNIEITEDEVCDILKKYGVPDKVHNINLYKRAFIHKSYCKRPALENDSVLPPCSSPPSHVSSRLIVSATCADPPCDSVASTRPCRFVNPPYCQEQREHKPHPKDLVTKNYRTVIISVSLFRLLPGETAPRF